MLFGTSQKAICSLSLHNQSKLSIQDTKNIKSSREYSSDTHISVHFTDHNSSNLKNYTNPVHVFLFLGKKIQISWSPGEN